MCACVSVCQFIYNKVCHIFEERLPTISDRVYVALRIM